MDLLRNHFYPIQEISIKKRDPNITPPPLSHSSGTSRTPQPLVGNCSPRLRARPATCHALGPFSCISNACRQYRLIGFLLHYTRPMTSLRNLGHWPFGGKIQEICLYKEPHPAREPVGTPPHPSPSWDRKRQDPGPETKTPNQPPPRKVDTPITHPHHSTPTPTDHTTAFRSTPTNTPPYPHSSHPNTQHQDPQSQTQNATTQTQRPSFPQP